MEWSSQLCSVISVIVLFITSVVNAAYIAKGNTIESRLKYLDKGAKKAWVDLNPSNLLVDGVLSQYHVFVHDVSQSILMSGVRLQIWRPNGHNKYKLIWEKPVVFTEGGYRRYMFNVEKEGIKVREGDHIGWTYEEEAGAISFTSVASATKKTAFATYEQLPEVGDTLDFGTITYPSVFSVGVSIREECWLYVGPNPLRQVSGVAYDRDQATYLDKSIAMQNGTLTKLMFYAQNIATPESDEVGITFHIFRQMGSDANEHTIVWNLDYKLKNGMGRQYNIYLDSLSTFEVQEGDYIGWTYQQNVFFISYSFQSGEYTFQQTFQNASYSVGETLNFDEALILPYAHMVAVEIDPDCEMDNKTESIVTPFYIAPRPLPKTTPSPPTTTEAPTTEVTFPAPARKPLPNWFPYAIIGVAIFIVIIIIVFVLLYLRDRNYRRTRYDVYDVKFYKNKNKGHSRNYDYPSTEIVFPTSVGLAGYKHDLNYYLDVPEYDVSNYENFTVQLGNDGERQVYDNAGFTAEVIIHHGDEEPVAVKNKNKFANGSAPAAHSEEIETIQHI